MAEKISRAIREKISDPTGEAELAIIMRMQGRGVWKGP